MTNPRKAFRYGLQRYNGHINMDVSLQSGLRYNCAGPMKQQSHSLRDYMHRYIVNFWETVIEEAKAQRRSCEEMGKLYYERGSYFMTKMEQSLADIEVEPLPHLQGRLVQIPVIQSMQDQAPTVQFSEVCSAIFQAQIEQQARLVNTDASRNNVSQIEFRISKESIELAIATFEKQLMKEHQSVQRSGIQERLSMAKGKRAIICMIASQYHRAAREFTQIISELEAQHPYRHLNLIAEYTFLLGNCHLLIDEPGCQQQAYSLFIKSLHLCVSHLQSLGYQTRNLSLPIDGKQVDRFPFLNKPGDPLPVKTTKEVMSIILDKIDDIRQLTSIKRAISQEQRTAIKRCQKREEQRLKKMQGEAIPLKNRKRRPKKQVESRYVQTSFDYKQDEWGEQGQSRLMRE